MLCCWLLLLHFCCLVSAHLGRHSVFHLLCGSQPHSAGRQDVGAALAVSEGIGLSFFVGIYMYMYSSRLYNISYSANIMHESRLNLFERVHKKLSAIAYKCSCLLNILIY